MRKDELTLHEREIGNQIYRYLVSRRGTAEKVVTKQQLCAEFKINEREPRKIMRFLRRKGFPVCSCSGDKGFFLADKNSPEDIEALCHTFNDLMSRSDDIVETARCLARCFADYGIVIVGRRAFPKEGV